MGTTFLIRCAQTKGTWNFLAQLVALGVILKSKLSSWSLYYWEESGSSSKIADTKEMGDVLSANDYRRWSECRKVKKQKVNTQANDFYMVDATGVVIVFVFSQFKGMPNTLSEIFFIEYHMLRGCRSC
ncbi:hypothetical protein AQUCO_04900007v1 [Aquilegia coerulea]|uniref:Uncharacterized protein n=1 Tax=Aquilegia coerulea TaxID=218851 RepID=A0A2G5CJB6_AQUCA|nr:hypothetical protein AQUCO_04900007v1 [Aquilegia coerulea]